MTDRRPGPTVFLVDDDPAVRRSLSSLLDAHGYRIEAHASASDFLAAGPPDRPGCLVLDLRMPETDGLAFQRELRRRGVALPVVFLTAHGDVPAAVRAMREGALAFLEKSADVEELLHCVAEAVGIDAERRERRARSRADAERLASLTPREREVLELMVEGLPNKGIAHRMGISIKTVEIHRARVMEKTGADSLAVLVRMVLEAGPGRAG